MLQHLAVYITLGLTNTTRKKVRYSHETPDPNICICSSGFSNAARLRVRRTCCRARFQHLHGRIAWRTGEWKLRSRAIESSSSSSRVLCQQRQESRGSSHRFCRPILGPSAVSRCSLQVHQHLMRIIERHYLAFIQ